MDSVVTSFCIARRDCTVLPCVKGAVFRRRLFLFLRTLCHLRDLVIRECREAVPADREDSECAH